MGIPELPHGPRGEVYWSGRVHTWRIVSIDDDAWIVHCGEDPRYEAVLRRAGGEYEYCVTSGPGAGASSRTGLSGLFRSTLV